MALLRGLNVGGKNALRMADLVTAFTGAGCTDVRSYIQSGNVAFRASPAVARAVPRLVAAAVAERYGVRSPVVLRTLEELARLAESNPFVAAGRDAALLHVAFLADEPDARCVASLDPARSPGDEFEVRGPDVYLHLPSGVARTRLTNAYLDSTLKTTSTLRNWRTVLKVLEMARSL